MSNHLKYHEYNIHNKNKITRINMNPFYTKYDKNFGYISQYFIFVENQSDYITDFFIERYMTLNSDITVDNIEQYNNVFSVDNTGYGLKYL